MGFEDVILFPEIVLNTFHLLPELKFLLFPVSAFVIDQFMHIFNLIFQMRVKTPNRLFLSVEFCF